MAAPSNGDEFLDLVRKSGVVDEARLDAYVQTQRASLPTNDLGRLAGVLVRDGILTHFQAEQFLMGKWRRFTIGKYKVLERVGSGGMGSVYLCEHRFMRRRVAVKVLPAAKAEDPAALERFYREARAVAALDHPNIVRAYDIDRDDKLHFLVMEYVEGSSLQEIIKKHGKMDITRAAHYAQQAAIGLQHAHQTAGLVHRDIKPGNVLLDKNGVVKILDMGLARFFHDEDDILTKKYDENVLGTADYLAPEQALDSHSVDIRADIYSLGATFYFCLTGNTPFTDGTVAQKLIWHQTRQPKPARSIRPEIPDRLAAILEKMMAKDPGQRFQNPAEVVAALAAFTQRPIPPPPDKEMPRLSPAAMAAGDTSITMSSPAPMTPSPAQKPAKAPSRPASPAPYSKPQTPAVAAATPPPSGRPGNGQFVNAQDRQAEAPPNWEMIAPKGKALFNAAKDKISFPMPKWLEPIRNHRYFWPGVGVAVLLFFIFVYILFGLVFGGSDEKNGSNTIDDRVTGETIVVKASGGDFNSIRAALQKAKPGDRILVQEETIEEPLVITPGTRYGKGVIIEAGAEGKRTIWTCPQNPRDGRFLFLADVEGLVIKGFTIDGKKNVDDLVSVLGKSPGLSLEDIEFTGFKRYGLSVWNCDATGDKKYSGVSIANCRFVADGKIPAALVLTGNERVTAHNTNLTIKGCRFEGPFDQAVLLSDRASGITFTGNRFFKSKFAFFYKTGSPRYMIDMKVENNTFCEISDDFFYFEAAPNFADGSKLTLKNNLFSRCGALATLKYTPAQKQPGATPARWIWFPEGEPHKNAPKGKRAFRKTFDIPNKTIKSAELDIGADDKFTVWINGRLVGAKGDNRVLNYPVAKFLKAGKNVIAVDAENAAGSAGLIVELVCNLDGHAPIKLGSDGSWKAFQSEPANWQDVAFDDKSWPGAKDLGTHKAGHVPWKGWWWDSSVWKSAPKEFGDFFSLGNNIRDPHTGEGNLYIRTGIIDFPPLPTDPAKSDFLIYPTSSPVAKLPTKVGVAPK